MKIIQLFLLLIPAVSLFAEIDFKAEFIPEVIFNIPGENSYDSALNPDNIMGVGDVMFSNDIYLKLDQQSESASLDLSLHISQSPDMLLSASLLRANASWMPDPLVKLTLGRQSYLTGYGYGWNPSDLANPPKNPTDPQAYLRGVDGMTIQSDHLPWMTVKAYALIPSQGKSGNYQDLLAGSELTFQASAMEFKLSGLYGGKEKDTDHYDLYPHALGAAFYVDLFGLGAYGEGVVRSRSRRNRPFPSASAPALDDSAAYSALGGIEYFFHSGLVGAAEYFYNGEGWDDSRRKDYAMALSVLSAAPPNEDYLGLYTPQYFARHYILLNLMIPWYAVDSSFNANIIYSPDSQAIFLTPSASFNINYEGSLVAELWYSGQYSLDDSQNNEARLSPVNHSILFNLKYYY